MNNLVKDDISVEKSTASNRVSVEFSILHIPLAGVLSMAMGCLPPSTPPSAAQIFSPAPNFFFQQTTGDVSLKRLTGAVCYTTDGSFQSYQGGTCAGGTTKTYAGNIELACGTGESAATPKTVTIVHTFNGSETSSHANYLLLCPVASYVKVFSVLGTGTTGGNYPGTVTVTGSAALNTDTGVLNFNHSANSVVAPFTDITTEESGTIEGGWGEPLMSAPVGLITISKCTNNDAPIDACENVNTDTPRDMGITAASDPIDFDLSANGVTEFSISVSRQYPEIPEAAGVVVTTISYTLTTLGSGSESTWYLDSDGDGYGDASLSLDDVIQPNGYVADATDCDDNDASRFPNNPEVCDGVDNDCDSIVPAGEADDDADNYLACADFVSSSDASVLGGNDCNDGNDGINPGVTETADLVDEDCDGEVDNGFKYIFVTSTATTGNLAQHDTDAGPDQGSPGLEGGDEFCQTHADSGSSIVPEGTYKAWLSDTTANAIYRLTDTGFPYVGVNGLQVAANRAGLTGQLNNAIQYYETGAAVDLQAGPQTWTGTKTDGTLFNNLHCNGWTDGSSSYEGKTGWPGYPGSNWTQWGSHVCGYAGVKLYCIQQ